MSIVPGFEYVCFRQESNTFSHDQDSTSAQNWMWYLIVIIDQGLNGCLTYQDPFAAYKYMVAELRSRNASN